MAKILIVEDNALNIKLFCDLLAAHGHAPQAVTDSRQALETARAQALEYARASGYSDIRVLEISESVPSSIPTPARSTGQTATFLPLIRRAPMRSSGVSISTGS